MPNDILVIETEETYTSKTSFIDNEELKVYSMTTQGNKSQLSGKIKNQQFILYLVELNLNSKSKLKTFCEPLAKYVIVI